jgi:aspartyl aminopeptidase
MTVLADKEETGSDGNTGMKSALLRDIIENIADKIQIMLVTRKA